MGFKEDHTFEARLKESNKIRDKFPGRIPLIAERAERCINIPEIDKCKFLAPCDLTIGQFIYIIRRRITLPSEKALFLFISGNVLPISSMLISEAYSIYADPDGFLYVRYSGENTFGL